MHIKSFQKTQPYQIFPLNLNAYQIFPENTVMKAQQQHHLVILVPSISHENAASNNTYKSLGSLNNYQS